MKILCDFVRRPATVAAQGHRVSFPTDHDPANSSLTFLASENLDYYVYLFIKCIYTYIYYMYIYFTFCKRLQTGLFLTEYLTAVVHSFFLMQITNEQINKYNEYSREGKKTYEGAVACWSM